jgi:RNA polymerase sigma-70 factor (ECF subfamily)
MASEVDAAYGRGAEAWPGLDATRDEFARIGELCRTRMESGGSHSSWDAVNASDVYLIAAIAGGNADAHAAFARAMLEPCRGALARLGLAPAVVDDVLAEVRNRLLVGDGESDGELPIVRHTGDGNLAALIRVMVVRAGINRQKREHRYTSEDVGTLDRLMGSHTPVGVLLSEEAKQLLRRVVAAAVATLGERDRALLRLHLYHGMTIDDLGQTYGVHRATAARWLAKVHDAIDSETRRALAHELRTESDHLHSVLDAARTGLTEAFAQALRWTAEAPPDDA